MTTQNVFTLIASLLGSGAIAASIAARAQRKQQFRERMISVASDFAATTMKVLAALRHYKPPKPGVRHHRNEPLISDHDLRAVRYEHLEQCFDELRSLRGRVRLHFPEVGSEVSEVTKRADDVVGALRDATDVSEKFWNGVDQHPKKRGELQERRDAEYHAARQEAWDKLNDFCNLAADSANRRESGPSLIDRLREGRQPDAIPADSEAGPRA
jgi:hypothetical protein